MSEPRPEDPVHALMRSLGIPHRFPDAPTVEEAMGQWDAREKWASKCPLATPVCEVEDQWGDWFDEAAKIVNQHRLSTQLLLYLCVRAMKPLDGAIISRSIQSAHAHEKLVDEFLLEKFPESRYAACNEAALLLVKRANSVNLARDNVQKRLSRYLRACTRHKRTVVMSNSRAHEMALAAIPDVVAQQLELCIEETSLYEELPLFWLRAGRMEIKLLYSLFKERSANEICVCVPPEEGCGAQMGLFISFCGWLLHHCWNLQSHHGAGHWVNDP
eukprot:GHVS01011917.1.p1 GENE.GHVS01011917.1~~GHVS01011917.1.p1  ORF type:complete len:273 (-),score=15.26 GHVS01011917.1:583-1401(-)